MRIFFFIPLLWAFASFAQPIYVQSGGVRLGVTSGFTFKRFLLENEAIEHILSGRKDGVQVTTLYQFYEPLDFSFNKNFCFYYGLGGHVGYEKYDDLAYRVRSYDPPIYFYEDKSYFILGADAIVGVEYRWLTVPMTIGFDVKPYLNFIGLRHLETKFWDSSISFKYIF